MIQMPSIPSRSMKSMNRKPTLVFYDFEVTKFDWMVVLIIPAEDSVQCICNQEYALEQFYQKHKYDVWCGYNSRHYDQYILKGILCGFDPWKVNEHIIFDKKPGWSFSDAFNKIFLINYDVQTNRDKSLKELEGFQGHNIHESSVSFSIQRRLTEAEAKEMSVYCRNDVLEAMNVFAATINDFNAILWLVTEYGFPLSYLNKTKAQISAAILQCVRTDFGDEWDISVLPCINLGKYKILADTFLDPFNHTRDLEFHHDVAGVRHDFGLGGVHGAEKKYHYKCDNDHLMLHIDVESFYPRLMIFHNLLTRAAKKPQLFRGIFEHRMQLKHEGKKKEQAPYKIVINGTFGIMDDKTNPAYDPRNAHLVTINGQLMLVDLIDKLETIPSFKLIQSNTDGLIVKIRKSDFEMLDDVCYEWESRCNMVLGFDYIEEIWQKDVNNYIFKQYDGKIERKGSYVKELSELDNDLPIVNKALVDFMLTGTPVEKTIGNCDDMVMFQRICKRGGSYDFVEWNNQKLDNKCFRIFASVDPNDGTVYKVKSGKEKDRKDKFANTSKNSFIENGDVTDMKVPSRLDKQWYIDLALTRLEQYGVGGQDDIFSWIRKD